jgi:hypothetical protein
VAQGAAATVGIGTGTSPYVGRLSLSDSTGHASAYTVGSSVTGTLPATFGAPAGVNYAVNTLLRAA